MLVTLPEELEERLSALARAAGRTESEYVCELIAERIGDLEDYDLAEKELAEVRAGRSKTYTLEEVERELGLDD